MPCLDEARTVGACVRNAVDFLETHTVVGEVIVVDNGSCDGSAELAREAGARVVVAQERGYGAALRCGILHARGRYVVMGDADESYDMGNLMPYLERLRRGDDLVVGNRFKGGIEHGAMPPLHRYFGNPFLTSLGRFLFGTRCGDYYCGQRGFTRNAVDLMDLRSTGMEFALEMLAKASLLGLKVSEVPAVLRPDGRGRHPHLRTWRDGWNSMRFLLLYSPRWLFLYPGLALMAVGAVTGAWILAGGHSVGGGVLGVHSFMYCAASVVVGFQLAAYSVFAKVMAVISGMHPRSARVDQLIRALPLERGVLVGALCALLGIAGCLAGAMGWAGSDPGAADPIPILRVAYPAVLFLVLGGLIIAASLLLGLLRIDWLHRFPNEESH
jgi:hypothetical protein